MRIHELLFILLRDWFNCSFIIRMAWGRSSTKLDSFNVQTGECRRQKHRRVIAAYSPEFTNALTHGN